MPDTAEAADPLRDEYLSVLKDIRLSAEQGKEFLSTEIPLVARELVTVRLIESSTGCTALTALLLAVTLLYAGVMRVAYREVSGKECKFDDAVGPMIFVSVVYLACMVLIGGGAASYGLDAAKAIYAPRVVVIEEVGKLIK